MFSDLEMIWLLCCAGAATDLCSLHGQLALLIQSSNYGVVNYRMQYTVEHNR